METHVDEVLTEEERAEVQAAKLASKKWMERYEARNAKKLAKRRDGVLLAILWDIDENAYELTSEEVRELVTMLKGKSESARSLIQAASELEDDGLQRILDHLTQAEVS